MNIYLLHCLFTQHEQTTTTTEVGEWNYKSWVQNSLEIIHEFERENKVYVEAQLGRVSKERRFMPLETTAAVLFAQSKGDGADFGMEGAANRFRVVLKNADQQLGPQHALSISAAADLGECLSQLGDCSKCFFERIYSAAHIYITTYTHFHHTI